MTGDLCPTETRLILKASQICLAKEIDRINGPVSVCTAVDKLCGCLDHIIPGTEGSAQGAAMPQGQLAMYVFSVESLWR